LNFLNIRNLSLPSAQSQGFLGTCTVIDIQGIIIFSFLSVTQKGKFFKTADSVCLAHLIPG
jgi:hypothetical protein